MLQDILEKHKGDFAPGTHTELRGQVNRSRKVSIIQGNVVNNVRSDTAGVSARVYKNGTYGFSSMAEVSDDAAKRVLKAASDNAAFMDSHVGKGKGPLPALSGENFTVKEDINDPGQKVYMEYARRLDEHISSKYKDLTSRTVVATEDSMEKLLKTSDGVDCHTILPRSYVFVILNAETKDGVPVELFEAFGGEGTFDTNFKDPSELYEKIDTLYKRIMDKREGVYASAGTKKVVLDGFLTGMLSHEAVGHTVEADLVLMGSVAGPYLNKRVASDKVTMTDFASSAFGEKVPLPVYVDDEGTVAKDITLIKDGILTGYMNSRELAQHFNMEPTGNARAWMFSDEPLVRMRNTVVHPGTDRLEDMIASIDDGYYLIQTMNGQADLTGEFMFGISMGYEIKNGKLGKALLDTTVSGVAFEMLKTVDMVSDEIVWSSSGFCGKKQMIPVGMGGPALRCEMMIGGR